MFGYIKTYPPELKVREQESYRALYCGLCREMGRCDGQCARLTLSYDFVFLTLVRLCVTGEAPSFRPRRCLVHPFRRRPMGESCEALAHSARCAALLNYWKCRDDCADERGWRRLRAYLLLPLLAMGRRRVRRTYAALDGRIAAHLADLSRLERERVDSVDLPANVFGELLRELCVFGLEGTAARLAAEIGYHVGRWIYLVDALDDREADAKRGAYNPFLLLHGTPTLTEEQKETVAAHLVEELMGIERALDLLDEDEIPYRDGTAILKNILYLGMPRVAREVLGEDEGEDARGSAP